MKPTSKISSLTKKDAVFYIVLFVFIVLCFEFVPSGWLEGVTTSSAYNVMRFFKLSSGLYIEGGVAYLTLSGFRDVSVEIIRECTAINVFAVIVGLVIPLRFGSWTRKAFSIIISGIMLFLMNLSRIILTLILTAYDLPPFMWMIRNPSIETYHYPISFLYGVIGVALLIVIISKLILPELGQTIIDIVDKFNIFEKRQHRRVY